MLVVMGGHGSGRKRKTPLELVVDQSVDPWERQPKESVQAYEAFLAYRAMRPRSMRATAELLGKTYGTMKTFAQDWRWTERALAWDRHEQRMTDAARIDERQQAARQMVRRHLSATQRVQEFCLHQLERYMAITGADEENPDHLQMPILEFKELVKAMEWAFGNERKNRGEPDSVTEINVNQANPGLEEALKGLPEETKAQFIRVVTSARQPTGTGGE